MRATSGWAQERRARRVVRARAWALNVAGALAVLALAVDWWRP